jgi:hypothetical protein
MEEECKTERGSVTGMATSLPTGRRMIREICYHHVKIKWNFKKNRGIPIKE